MKVDDVEFRIKYKTYKFGSYKIDFFGSFSCKPHNLFTEELQLDTIEYFEAKKINADFKKFLTLEAPERMSVFKINSIETYIKNQHDFQRFPEINQKTINAKIIKFNKAVGNWIGNYSILRRKTTTTIVAKVTGNFAVANYVWSVDNNTLTLNASGSVIIKDQQFDYIVSEKTLQLSSTSGIEMEIPIKLVVNFENGPSDYIIKCVPYKNDCTVVKREIPGIKEYLTKFDKEFGILMI